MNPTGEQNGELLRPKRQGPPLRVLLADDHPLILVGIRSVLEEDERFEVVGEAHSGPAVLPLTSRLAPDLVVLDLRMPGIDGLGCLDRIRSRYPNVKVVILSVSSDPEHVQAAFQHGACGYVLKTIDPADLPAAIHESVDGTAFHALGLPALTDQAVAEAAGLTERELEIARAVAQGQSNQMISKKLWVTEQTVKFHLTKIFRKLGVDNRTEVARWVFKNGLAEESDEDLASMSRVSVGV